MQSGSVTNSETGGTERRRVPRRVIHCNDGVIEEFSTDEDDDVDGVNTKPTVDPVTCTVIVCYVIRQSVQNLTTHAQNIKHTSTGVGAVTGALCS